MAAFSSNGTSPKPKAAKQIGGRFFKEAPRPTRGVHWPNVDGDLLRMTMDALCRGGHMIGFAQASEGMAIKVMIWTDGKREDAYAKDAATLNALMRFVLDDLQAKDDELRDLFNEVSTWLESRD